MEVLIKIAQFFLSLSILIIIHECGHYFAARLFKIRVEKFYLFFNPWFSLFKFKYKETEYGMGWLPLGGYVKIAGMIDESMDKEQMKQEPQPYEFRTKPAWQRLIVMVAGVVMNIFLAIGIYISLLFFVGETYLPTKNLKYGISVDTLAYEIGLRDGDKVLSIDNKYVDNFKEIPIEIIFNQSKTIQIERDSQIININIPDGFVGKILKSKNVSFIDFQFPFVIDGFSDNSIAQNAGLLVNDRIIAINDIPTPFFNDFKKELPNHLNQSVNMTVLRGEEELNYVLELSDRPLIGVAVKSPAAFIDFAQKH